MALLQRLSCETEAPKHLIPCIFPCLQGFPGEELARDCVLRQFLARVTTFFYLRDHPFLKYWTSRSCFAAAVRVEKVPRLRRRPVLGFFFREYRRYCPDGSLRMIGF